MKLASFLLLFLFACSVWAADFPPAVITDITVIPLQIGVNKVAHFASDGRTGLIVKAWRDNSNAHGYNRYMVLLRNSTMENEWNVVTVEHDHILQDSIRDDPHTFEDIVTTVLFARAKLNGKPTTLLLEATRDWKESMAEFGPVKLSFYKLAHNSEGLPGFSEDYFILVKETASIAKYNNANFALKTEWKIKGLPEYRGELMSLEDYVISIAETYLITQKQWKKSDFYLVPISNDSKTIRVQAINREDEKNLVGKNLIPGGGKSVELQIDITTKTVIKELAFQ